MSPYSGRTFLDFWRPRVGLAKLDLYLLLCFSFLGPQWGIYQLRGYPAKGPTFSLSILPREKVSGRTIVHARVPDRALPT